MKEKKIDLLNVLCKAFSITFCIILLSVIAVFAVTPKKSMSESENRVLAKMPEFSFSALADGSFMKNFETYLSDQFPFRDKVISAKTSIDMLYGKREENGVFVGKNSFLFEKQSEFDRNKVLKLTKSISDFSASHKKINTAVLISPNSSEVLSEFLPSGAEKESQAEQLKKIQKGLKESNIKWINCVDTFSSQKDKSKLFYRTDHHWTTNGAYSAFSLLAKVWKLDTKKANYKFYTVSNSFQGTLASMSGINNSFDEVSICVPEQKNLKYVVSFEKDGRKTATFFEKEKLSQKNQYEVFLGGNFDKIVVSTNVDNTKTLLLFKDSYANCMIPMLAPHFSKIVVVDPRYYSDNLSVLMKEYSFTHCLFLYNLNTFLLDTSLCDVLES